MEITINGEITSDAPSQFTELDSDVTVRLNSPGGDITAALTIYNRLKAHSNVTIIVEGLCASAATIVACGGRVKAFENALYMIHSPLASLGDGLYQADDLSKTIEALTAFEGSIVNVYATKTGLSEERLRTMMEAETWLTAEDALALGFVDEIIPERATVENKGGVMYVNRLAIDTRGFKRAEELRKMSEMSNETLLTKLKAFFGGKDDAQLQAKVSALEAENAKLRGENKTLREELTATKALVKTNDQIYALIEDNLKSGASRVQASTSEAQDERQANIKKVIEFANRGRYE